MRSNGRLPPIIIALPEGFAQPLLLQNQNEFANQAFLIAHGCELHSGLGVLAAADSLTIRHLIPNRP
jgi:hypothetical protein